MNKHDGWIKLFRKIVDWEWYQDTNAVRVFIHLVLMANHEDCKWNGLLIKRGQRVTSVDSIFNELNRSRVTGRLVKKTAQCTIGDIRGALKRLILTNELTIKTSSNYSVITITKYDLYQGSNKLSNTLLTNDEQTTNKQLTTNKNDKKEENEKNINKESNVPVKTGTDPVDNWKPEYGEKYIEAFNRLFNSQYRVTPARVAKLKVRFKTYTPEQISTALGVLSKSKFHRGDNDRGWKADPDFLIRNDEQVDKWLNKGGGEND